MTVKNDYSKDTVDAVQSSILSVYTHDNQREAALALLESLKEKGFVVVKESEVSLLPKSGNI